jgi:hypothetical protein
MEYVVEVELTVSAISTSDEPSNDTEPVASPLIDINLGVCREFAVSAFLPILEMELLESLKYNLPSA